MVERVQGSMTRLRNREEEEGNGEEEEEDTKTVGGKSVGVSSTGSAPPKFSDEDVAKKVFDDLVKATIEAHGETTVDELLRKLTSRFLKAMTSEEADAKIDEEIEKAKRPEVVCGKWEMAAVDCMDGNRVMW